MIYDIPYMLTKINVGDFKGEYLFSCYNKSFTVIKITVITSIFVKKNVVTLLL